MKTTLILSILLSACAAVPAIPKNAKAGDTVPGSFLVVLKPNLASDRRFAHRSWAREHGRKNSIADFDFGKLKGYTGSFDDEAIKAIKGSPDVAYIEQDTVVTASVITIQQDGAPWGISRISQNAPLPSVDLTKYYYDDTAGQNTWIYILDTGIRFTHTEFSGRAELAASFVSETAPDGHGHGTHVAGIAGSNTYGVAKKSRLIGVKVLNSSGSGTVSGVLSGLDWALNNATASKMKNRAVLNMSLGGSYSALLNSAVAGLVDSGLTVVVAAGNENQNTGSTSPGSEPKVITVGASNETDGRRPSSNWGPLVDIFAPGTNIRSTWATSDTATQVLSGTSMASPHVAGVVAYLIELEGLSTPQVIDARLKELGLPVIQNGGTGSTNLLLYNGAH